MTQSDLTREMLGPPNFPDAAIPTWEEFNEDYLDHYFDDSAPLKGRCFILMFEEQEVGQINYNEIDAERKCTEIDIWLAARKYTGKGWGTSAIEWLCDYLLQKFDCKAIFIAPSRRNKMAIKAYTKAGFVELEKIPDNITPDYKDTVVLIKEFN